MKPVNLLAVLSVIRGIRKSYELDGDEAAVCFLHERISQIENAASLDTALAVSLSAFKDDLDRIDQLFPGKF